MIKHLFLLAGILITASCASRTQSVRTYSGAPRPLPETAQLAAASEFEIRSLDGAKGTGGMFSKAAETIYEMLPGPHQLTARFYSPFEASSGGGAAVVDRSEVQELSFHADAGRRYAIKRKMERDVVKLYIEETGPALALTNVEARPTPAAPAPAIAQPAPPPDGLKAQWLKASPAERAQFRAWLDTQRD